MHSHSHNNLWLALRFPWLPLEALGFHASDSEAMVIGKQQKVFCANAQALAKGVHCGMDCSSAQILSGAKIHEHDGAREQQALQHLQSMCYAFTPYIELQQHGHGLLLEVSRCLKLFKGLEKLTHALRHQLRQQTYEQGIAHTAEGAWLLSWKAHPANDKDTRENYIQRLHSIPIELLSVRHKTIDALNKTGFNTLGDVCKQIQTSSTSSLRKRFGKEFSDYIKNIFAIENNLQQQALFTKPTKQYHPEDYFCEHIQLDYPLNNMALIEPLMEKLLRSFNQYLNKRQIQSQSLLWRLYDIHHNKEERRINFPDTKNPHTSWKFLLDLSRIQFEHQPLPFEVDTLELFCNQFLSRSNPTGSLNFPGTKKRDNEALQLTLAKIKSRLGDHTVYKVSYKHCHIPEESSHKIALCEKPNEDIATREAIALRPTWLLKTPQIIKTHNKSLLWQGKLQIIQGPERIEGYWWRKPCARDYFIAIREDKLRVWIYFDRTHQLWYVHGIFA